MANLPELYVVVNTDFDGNIVGYPTGGRSSTKPCVKAHMKLSSARRSAKYFNAKVMKVITGEVVE